VLIFLAIITEVWYALQQSESWTMILAYGLEIR